MKIAIEMQGALSPGSRTRGIGRYTLDLVRAMACQRGADIHLLLNDSFDQAASETEAEFKLLAPEVATSRFRAPTLSGRHKLNFDPRRRLSDDIMRRAVAAIGADVLLGTSLCEDGPCDFRPINLAAYPVRLSVGILYDLVPLIYSEIYLNNPTSSASYREALNSLSKADLVLAISESARRDGIERLGLDPERVVSISAAADAKFHRLDIGQDERDRLRKRLGLRSDFVLCVSGADPRKNLRGAIDLIAGLPPRRRRETQLLLISDTPPGMDDDLRRHAHEAGLRRDGLVLARGVADGDLVPLFNMASALVFPSRYEGFGLPVLEAMQCGTPVVVADTSSLPEIVDRADLLYPVDDSQAGSQVLSRLLEDHAYAAEVSAWGLRRAEEFSWTKSAATALAAIDEHASRSTRDVAEQRAKLLDLRDARQAISAAIVRAPAEDAYVANFVSDLLFSVPQFQEWDVAALDD